jgi:hypothetical protein
VRRNEAADEGEVIIFEAYVEQVREKGTPRGASRLEGGVGVPCALQHGCGMRCGQRGGLRGAHGGAL